jgi:hypothetical protein
MVRAVASRLEEILETCSELAEDVTYPSVKRWREVCCQQMRIRASVLTH